MARKCNAPGCGFYLPDRYPSAKCPWHLAPGRGPVKIAAALTIAAAGFGGGFAYKKFRNYLEEKKQRKEREQSRKRQTAAARKRNAAPKRPRPRKKSAAKSKRNQSKRSSETQGKAASQQ